VAVDPLLPSGAAMLIPRSVLTATGALDESTYAYGEDAEFGLRVLRAGARCVYAPDAVVYHRGGGTWGAASVRKAFLVERNRARLAAVHLPWSWLLRAPVATTARYIDHACASTAGGGPMGAYPHPLVRIGASLAAVAGLAAGVAELPRHWRRRREVAAIDRLGPVRFEQLLDRRGVGRQALRRRNHW
jgi:hypothetical protein